MDQTIIPVATALISTLGAFVSLVFARRSARRERLETADQVAMKFREPLLQAAFNLQARIYNTLDTNLIDVMDPDARRVPLNMRNHLAARIPRAPRERVEDQAIAYGSSAADHDR